VPAGLDVRCSTGRRRTREPLLSIDRERLEQLRRAAREKRQGAARRQFGGLIHERWGGDDRSAYALNDCFVSRQCRHCRTVILRLCPVGSGLQEGLGGRQSLVELEGTRMRVTATLLRAGRTGVELADDTHFERVARKLVEWPGDPVPGGGSRALRPR